MMPQVLGNVDSQFCALDLVLLTVGLVSIVWNLILHTLSAHEPLVAAIITNFMKTISKKQLLWECSVIITTIIENSQTTYVEGNVYYNNYKL